MRQKDTPLKQKRIFIGFNSAGSAGIYAFTRILRRRGYQIDFYGIGKKHFNMPVDFMLEFSANPIRSLLERIVLFFRLLPKYDLWHLNFLETFFFYPVNLAILKLFGRKIILTCRGVDVRNGLDFLPKELFNKTNNWPQYYQKIVAQRSRWITFKQRLRVRTFVYFADKIILTGPFLASAVSKYDRIIPYAREIGALKKYKKNTKKIKILHVPSEPVVKGSQIIEKTFKKLQKKYPKYEFKILSKLPHQQLLLEMAQADIVVDQLLVGWYGGQAVEAMAMGKIVMAYLNAPYLALVDFADEIPIVNTNVWTFGQDLTDLLENLVENQKNMAEKSVKFAQKYHNAAKIAQSYEQIYKDCL